MYSLALTKRRNNAMIARKELKKLDPHIQAFLKYPAKLMVRKAGKKRSTECMVNISIAVNEIVESVL